MRLRSSSCVRMRVEDLTSLIWTLSGAMTRHHALLQIIFIHFSHTSLTKDSTLCSLHATSAPPFSPSITFITRGHSLWQAGRCRKTMTSSTSSVPTCCCSPPPPLSHEITMEHMSGFKCFLFQHDKLLLFKPLARIGPNILCEEKTRRQEKDRSKVKKQQHKKGEEEETFLFSQT